MVRVEYTRDFIVKAMQHPKTRAALAAKAARVRGRAEALAGSEKVKLDASTSSGTRPKGRPYARVSSPNVAQEWGNSKTARRRILGRAAESS
jgi:hypothetical protein